ncbi:hypothetical protein LCGC14_2211860, partial [marine sediment metagenome]
PSSTAAGSLMVKSTRTSSPRRNSAASIASDTCSAGARPNKDLRVRVSRPSARLRLCAPGLCPKGRCGCAGSPNIRAVFYIIAAIVADAAGRSQEQRCTMRRPIHAAWHLSRGRSRSGEFRDPWSQGLLLPYDSAMSDEPFHEGQKVWLQLPDAQRRPAIYVGEGENATFFGGPPLVYVVLADTRKGVEVELSHIVPRAD